jgi:hypothetical protein
VVLRVEAETMHLIAQGLGGWLEVFLGLICLGFLAVVVFLLKAASLLMKNNQDFPSSYGQYPQTDDAHVVSSGPPSEGDKARRAAFKGLGVAVYALTGAILGGVLVWPVVIVGSFGAVLFALGEPGLMLIITSTGAVVGGVLGAMVGVALAASAGRKPPPRPAANTGAGSRRTNVGAKE